MRNGNKKTAGYWLNGKIMRNDAFRYVPPELVDDLERAVNGSKKKK
jgi:hypothetical protein